MSRLVDDQTLRGALAPLVGVEQDPRHHPEGGAWEHSLLVGRFMEEVLLPQRWLPPEEGIQDILVVAAYLHDIGKATTTVRRPDGRLTSYGHAEAGAPIAWECARAWGLSEGGAAQVRRLVQEHMSHFNLKSEKSYRNLAHRLAADGVHPASWALLVEADLSGRAPREPEGLPEGVLEKLLVAWCGLRKGWV